MNDMNERKAVEMGEEAKRVLESNVWKEAWSAYRENILTRIEAAGSADTEMVLHLKRLLTAASAAKSHLERLIAEGQVAAANLRYEESVKKRSFMERILG